MRRLLLILMLVLLSAAVVLAEEHSSGRGKSHDNPGVGQGKDKDNGKDDHDDKSPTQTGYAVITPVVATTSGTATGLVVFETFGLRNQGDVGTLQAGVLPPDLTTNAVMFVETSGRLKKNLGVAVVNPNNAAANITMTLRKSDGTVVGTTNPPVTVPAYAQVSKYVTDLFSDQSSIPSDIEGTLAITSGGTSALPVSVIGVRSRGVNFSTLPVTNLSGSPSPLPSIKPNVGGAGAILLPEFVTGGGWATELVIMNSNIGAGQNLTVRVDLFKPNGDPLTATLNGQTASSFTTLAAIPPGGVLTLAPRDKNGDDDF